VRNQYLNTLRLNDAAAKSKALDRAHELRRFEIEHYWKRATYFWGFQIAIFAAFGLLWKDSSLATTTPGSANPWSPVTLALSGLGVLTALANSLSAHGSKFWQENWEKHIDMLEDEIEGRLHKTVWLSSKGKRSFSVSRVNEWLSYYFVVFWFLVTSYAGYKFAGPPPLDSLRVIFGWWPLVIVVIVLGAGLLLFCKKSRLDGTYPKENGDHDYDNEFEQSACWSKRAPKSRKFIRRYALGEEPPPRTVKDHTVAILSGILIVTVLIQVVLVKIWT
jgi:hypothetical protein